MNRIIFKFNHIILFLTFILLIGCNKSKKIEQNLNAGKTDSTIVEISTTDDKNNSNKDLSFDDVDIIVFPCANGYEYAMHNFDFNPVIENELNKFDKINVKSFPYKTLMGVNYQGIFDKKYCSPVFEKTDVDFLILTRFDKPYNGIKNNELKWGYELRIVKSGTLEQINSINAHNLNNYMEIEKHIKNNIEKLKKDIEKLI